MKTGVVCAVGTSEGESVYVRGVQSELRTVAYQEHVLRMLCFLDA
jgi:hypothetical protein